MEPTQTAPGVRRRPTDRRRHADCSCAVSSVRIDSRYVEDGVNYVAEGVNASGIYHLPV